ncbi:MAG: CBS domain-containing protein [Saprospiraceae bacterium]|nr:CBS domain-containing protein [Saprospiraceae bacterium]
MGEQRVSLVSDQKQMTAFVRQLLDDISALEYMLENDWFEKGITRIGAEQEMCLVDDRSFKPAPIAMEALKNMKEYPWVETELAKFNLETNLMPRTFKGKALSLLEKENLRNLRKIQKRLGTMDASLILTGILPTLRKFHLDREYLTPKKRYHALMDSIDSQLQGQAYELRLLGIDELLVRHNSPLLEACNTSFQVHLQVAPDDFVKMYNIAQTVAAPVIAIAANSPIVFGRRLWHESRIALFQQALDTRTTHDHLRERSPRVNFGNDWLRDSVLEIYKEDIARFRVLIAGDLKEDSLKMIQKGKVPKLRALQVHNSTVYRWNRPCYGISPNGKPHLRIENRVLAAGPTVLDEVANAAFWLGVMMELGHRTKDISELISYADVRDNFAKASRYGMDSKFTWFKDKKINAIDLVRKELLPMARAGLKRQKIATEDINRYLGVIEGRCKKHMNGARWQLRAYTHLISQTTREEALTCLTASIIKNQQEEKPVHTWKLPQLSEMPNYNPNKTRVEEIMTTDLFTVQKDDIIELVAELMDWRKIRNTPVEDSKGNLIGLVTSRGLLKHYMKKGKLKEEKTLVKEIMIKDPLTIGPEATLSDAIRMMSEKEVGCLPVVDGEELIGVITEVDFLRITRRLLEQST